MDSSQRCEAEQLINSYGGLAEAKAYMKRWFKLSKITKNTQADAYVKDSMHKLNEAIAVMEQSQ
ncbi:hypothetical protein ACYU0V_13235 [Acinetobacter sp. X9]